MEVSLTEWCLAIYFAGFILNSIRSIRRYFVFQHIKLADNLDVLTNKPFIKRELLLRPFIWPYYFVSEKSPLARLSETFFRNYGDDGQIYFGSRGIKNFLYDIFLGKDRYRDLKIMTLVCEASETNESSRILQKFIDNLHANLVFGFYKGKYLLKVNYGREDSFLTVQTISRYMIDECERLSANRFISRIKEINPNALSDVMHRLEKECEIPSA